MSKKIFAFILGFTIILATSFVFATNELKDSMDKTKTSVQNVLNGTENVVKDTTSAIGTGIQNIGNSARNTTSHISDSITRTDTQNGYTATRTNAENSTILGMSANTWTWFVLAIAALAIVGLVWYYAMQNKTDYGKHHNH